MVSSSILISSSLSICSFYFTTIISSVAGSLCLILAMYLRFRIVMFFLGPTLITPVPISDWPTLENIAFSYSSSSSIKSLGFLASSPKGWLYLSFTAKISILFLSKFYLIVGSMVDRMTRRWSSCDSLASILISWTFVWFCTDIGNVVRIHFSSSNLSYLVASPGFFSIIIRQSSKIELRYRPLSWVFERSSINLAMIVPKGSYF